MLSSVLSFAVGIMLAFHLQKVPLFYLYFVTDALDYLGETTVEAQDFQVYQKWAGGRGEVASFSALFRFLFDDDGCLELCKLVRSLEGEEPQTAPWSIPFVSQSIRLFAKVSRLNSHFRLLHAIFIPIRVRLYTDGWSWARKPGYEELRMDGDVLTDEDDDEMPQQP